MAESRCLLGGVSSPLRVVRSMQLMAFNSQAACHSFLIERRAVRLAVRAKTALRLTRAAEASPRSRSIPGLRGSCFAEKAISANDLAVGMVSPLKSNIV